MKTLNNTNESSLERDNFLLWYKYATDIELAEVVDNKIYNELSEKYAEDIESIDRIRRFEKLVFN